MKRARAEVKGRTLLFTLFIFTSIVNYQLVEAQSYCSSEGTTTYDTGVSHVILGDIDNQDIDNTDNAYEDYTATTTSLVLGSDYSLTVKGNTDGGSYTVHGFVWIDWNDDGDFDDTDEEIDMGSVTGVSDGHLSNSPYTLTVPSGATGTNVRMRVSVKYASDPTSCATGFDGEVEDYELILTSGSPTITINSTSAGSNQVAFNNVYWNSTEPIFAVTPSATVDRIYIELNTKSDFTGTAYTQTFSGTYTAVKVDLTCDGLSTSLPSTAASYAVRFKASDDAGSTWGDWTTDNWVYSKATGSEGIHYTTSDQFDSGTLTSTNYGNFISSNDNATTTDLADDYLQVDQGSITNTMTTAGDQYLTENPDNYSGASYSFITVGSAWVSSTQKDDYHGFRFQGAKIPQGATIQSAYLNVYASNSGSEPQSNTTNTLNLKIRGADVDDCAAWADNTNSSTGDPISRTRTTAAVDWDISASWSDLELMTSPDITTVVQEIVDRGSYAAGNDLGVILDYDGGVISTNDAHRYLATGTRGAGYLPYLTATFTNFSNEIVYPDESLASIDGATTWDELIFDVEKSGCGACDVVFTVYDASDDSQIATGNTSPLDLSSSSAANIYVKVLITRNSSPKVNSFTITATGGSELTPLPIELLSFDTQCEEAYNLVNWTTASEENNEKFILESSVDGESFTFNTEVLGSGTTSDLNYYEVRDYFLGEKSQYYRLSQVDYNGDTEVFPIISSKCDYELDQESINIAANSEDGYIDITWVISTGSNQYSLSVYDINGKRIFTENHLLKTEDSSKRLHLSIPSGVYLVSVESNNQTMSEKFIW